jgi:hypothetical protein
MLLLGFEIDNTGGPELTVTDMLLDAVQLEGEVAVKLYTVLVVGETTSEELVAPVLHE